MKDRLDSSFIWMTAIPSVLLGIIFDMFLGIKIALLVAVSSMIVLVCVGLLIIMLDEYKYKKIIKNIDEKIIVKYKISIDRNKKTQGAYLVLTEKYMDIICLNKKPFETIKIFYLDIEKMTTEKYLNLNLIFKNKNSITLLTNRRDKIILLVKELTKKELTKKN